MISGTSFFVIARSDSDEAISQRDSSVPL
jgi:hypothetical protein